MSTSTEQHADPLPMVTILQRGIRQALMDEAMEWTGDARVEVWMALIGTGNRMGIVITKDQLYEMQRERQGLDERHNMAGTATTTTRAIRPEEQETRHYWDGRPMTHFTISPPDAAQGAALPSTPDEPRRKASDSI